ncbi:MAG: MerR family transcriptional regulator [Anaerolineae bacterium]|nr:MerR family transcriptional regulator [Anaerolineae bacterium]
MALEFYQDLDGQPIYNIKAVVEATGLPAATLRAWERRYGALSPGRTESGYRLYSARDIAVLRWLKARVDEGMNISQAIQLLSQARPGERSPQSDPRRVEVGNGPRATRDALLNALLRYDESTADQMLEEAFAIYGLESVTESVLAPAMAQIGDMWHEGRTTTATEHFASNYLRRKIDSIINAAPQSTAGPLVILGCAPGDWHELGLLMIYLMLRRRSINTIYLGQNVPVEQFVEEMERLKPAMVIMSAATAETVAGLIAIGSAVQAMPAPRPLFAFGGRIFNAQPELKTRVPGVFLGESARSAVSHITNLISEWPSQHSGSILRMKRSLTDNP